MVENRLANWVSNVNGTDHKMDNSTGDVDFYLSIYATVAVANTVFSLIRAFLFAYGGMCAAKTIHSQLLKSVLRGRVIEYKNGLI